MGKNDKYKKRIVIEKEGAELYDDEADDEALSAVISPRNLNVIYSLNNHLYYYKDIDNEGAALFCKTITEMYYTTISNILITGLSNPVIEIHINSEGGEAASAFAMASKIEEIKRGFGPVPIPMKVITHVEGETCSGGSIMSVVGNERTISRYSYMLIHKATSGFIGKNEEMKDHLQNIDLLDNIMKKIYKENSKLTDEIIDEVMGKDIYLSPEKCLEYGLVDRII